MKKLQHNNYEINQKTHLKKTFFTTFYKNTLTYICIFMLFTNCDSPSFSSSYAQKDTIIKQKLNKKLDEKLSQKSITTIEKDEKIVKNQNKKIKENINLKVFFEKYVKPKFESSKIINYSPKNGFLAFEESSPPNSEISAIVYGNLALWTGKNRDIVGFFYYALVEGSSNLQMDNMFFYDADGKNITKEVLDIAFIKKEMQKAIPERKTRGFEGFNDFFLEIPENGTKIIFQLTNGEKLAEGDKIFANFLTMDFNKKTEKFEVVEEIEYP